MSTVTRALVALLIALGLVPGLLPGPGLAPAANAADYKPWGRAAAPDQRLRAGCHAYRYHYRIKVPSNEWSAEVFLVNRKHVALGTQNLETPDDEKTGHGTFRVCRASTVPGRHKLKMRVSWYENDPERTVHRGWVHPTYFRLYR
ncbi:hypothetical protein [Nocardioides panacisoli]|uniref:Uncharacterized protein n=1 Tax=Nocardioides panacisoli TaxID=627624 RepID=A0ABP7INZ2_9ACTN